MARTVAELPPGARITDYIDRGVITKTFPLSNIGQALSKTGPPASVRATCRRRWARRLHKVLSIVDDERGRTHLSRMTLC